MKHIILNESKFSVLSIVLHQNLDNWSLLLSEITLTLTLTLLTLTLKSYPFFFPSTAFFSSLYFRLLVSFFSYMVDVNKNCRTLFSLPQLLFLFGFFWFLSLAATLVFDWDSSLYCLIVFLSFSQDFIVHCHRGSFCPIGFVFNFLETLAETSNLQGF